MQDNGPARIYVRLRVVLHPKTARLSRKSAANIASPLPVLASAHPPPPPDEGGGGGRALKVAVSVAPSLSVHVPVPPQAPPIHPPKVDSLAAAAVSITLVPMANDAEQVVPQ